MAEDLQTNLATYKLQLQQVEASLTTDPENEDLQKLRKDLQEVIDLTEDLIGTKLPTQTSEVVSSDVNEVPTLHWKTGDSCMAIWSDDGQYYNCKIDEILEDGTCTVTFDGWTNTEVTNVTMLKPADPNAPTRDERQKSKRDKIAEQREYKKKKSQKKAQRLKQMEEEREAEKNKWLDFNAKTFSKTSKGKVKKSIFATPDHVNGKVGVGTCGQSGRPMTKYSHQEKWKK